MKELKEIRFNGTDVILNDNLVRGAILPERIAELNRNIIFSGDTLVEGAIFGNRIEVRAGNIEVQGAVFTQQEFYVDSDMKGSLKLCKAVGSANSIVSRAAGCRPTFCSDINAKNIALRNAFVAGSIYAEEITLENCVVIGGVFATRKADIHNSIVGTFNSPDVMLKDKVYLLLPSAFSIQEIRYTPGTKLYNLSLADLGALYKGLPENPDSGQIEMNLKTDEVTSNLHGGENERTMKLRSYTVAGKVLAADLIDTEKFQNHFLLTAASLGSQLLKVYDLGPDASGKPTELTIEKIRDFFFDILNGKIAVRPLDGTFELAKVACD